MRVNLHTHSTESDGILKPPDLIRRLHKNKVKFISLTDHDSIEGLNEAKAESDKLGIKFINGIEFSTDISELNIDFLDTRDTTIHMLGLGFDYDKLYSILHDRKIAKRKRVDKLNIELKNKGYKLDDNNSNNKRTYVAKSLVGNGYATNIQEAFNNIINHYYDRTIDSTKVSDVVKMIHNAKGVVIWAHPYEILKGEKINLTINQIDKICNKLKEFNVDGIEAYYYNYSESQKEDLIKLQNKYNFISSCGTDDHAKNVEEMPYYEIEESLIKEVLEL